MNTIFILSAALCVGEPPQVPEPMQHVLSGKKAVTKTAPTRCGCGSQCDCEGVQGGVCDCPRERPRRDVKSCPCGPACECGCNEGEPCGCGNAPPRRIEVMCSMSDANPVRRVVPVQRTAYRADSVQYIEVGSVPVTRQAAPVRSPFVRAMSYVMGRASTNTFVMPAAIAGPTTPRQGRGRCSTTFAAPVVLSPMQYRAVQPQYVPASGVGFSPDSRCAPSSVGCVSGKG
jgi:hypothetical protein